MGSAEDAQQTHHKAESKFLNSKMQPLLFNSLHWNLEILFLVPVGYRLFGGRKDEQMDPISLLGPRTQSSFVKIMCAS